MLVTRNAYPERAPHLDIEDCLGCSDCNGICPEVLQLLASPSPRLGESRADKARASAQAPGAATRRPLHTRASHTRLINRT